MFADFEDLTPNEVPDATPDADRAAVVPSAIPFRVRSALVSAPPLGGRMHGTRGECNDCRLLRRTTWRSCHYCDAIKLLGVPPELFERSRNATLFGFLYRDTFEEDLTGTTASDDHAHSHYLLVPSEILVFAGVAAISGVIGNIAYDILKGIVKRILSGGLGMRSVNKPDRAAAALLDSDEALNRFLAYVGEYATAPLSSADPKVRDHVLEEVITFARVDVHLHQYAIKKKEHRMSLEEERRAIKEGVRRRLVGDEVTSEAARLAWEAVGQRLETRSHRKSKHARKK